jgi:ketosteroid isomerase-like protein
MRCLEEAFRALLGMVTEDAEFLPPNSTKLPWGHPFRGRREIEQYFKTLAEALEFQAFQADELSSAANLSSHWATNDA